MGLRQLWIPAGVALAALLSGCGDEGSSADRTVSGERPATETTERQTLRDARDDVLVKPADRERAVTREQLDLLRVTIARTGGTLTVSFVTAAPPAAGMTQVVETYDRRQVVEAPIEIRHRRNGAVRAVARPPRGTYEPVSVKVVGREAVVRVPLNEYTRERVCKWRAHTVSTRPTSEIRDRVPSGVNAIAFFPDTGG